MYMYIVILTFAIHYIDDLLFIKKLNISPYKVKF